jgi:hypothetical protein
VIVYGANKIKPVFLAARELHDAQKKGEALPNSAPTSTEAAPNNSAVNPAGTETPAPPKDSGTAPTTATAEPKPVEAKPAEIIPEKIAPKKTENTLSPKAVEYKGRIEQVFADRGLAGRAKVQATGNTLTLAGKLRPV